MELIEMFLEEMGINQCHDIELDKQGNKITIIKVKTNNKPVVYKLRIKMYGDKTEIKSHNMDIVLKLADCYFTMWE